jgi:hypothetical protein
MSESVQMDTVTLGRRTRAIVCFGPATPVTGMRAGEYYQVVIDPDMSSPGGDYIRFDGSKDGIEIHGWQRVGAITICEMLEELEPDPKGQTINMRAVVKE